MTAPGASVAFRLRQLSEGLRAFPTDRQGQQRVDFDRSPSRQGKPAFCAKETAGVEVRHARDVLRIAPIT